MIHSALGRGARPPAAIGTCAAVIVRLAASIVWRWANRALPATASAPPRATAPNCSTSAFGSRAISLSLAAISRAVLLECSSLGRTLPVCATDLARVPEQLLGHTSPDHTGPPQRSASARTTRTHAPPPHRPHAHRQSHPRSGTNRRRTCHGPQCSAREHNGSPTPHGPASRALGRHYACASTSIACEPMTGLDRLVPVGAFSRRVRGPWKNAPQRRHRTRSREPTEREPSKMDCPRWRVGILENTGNPARSTSWHDVPGRSRGQRRSPSNPLKV